MSPRFVETRPSRPPQRRGRGDTLVKREFPVLGVTSQCLVLSIVVGAAVYGTPLLHLCRGCAARRVFSPDVAMTCTPRTTNIEGLVATHRKVARTTPKSTLHARGMGAYPTNDVPFAAVF
jgi:hypothetical protein